MRACLALFTLTWISAAAMLSAQSAPAPAAPAPRPGYDLAYIGPPLADSVLQTSKETYVVMGCAYCHGMDLTPRGEAADLRRSPIVGGDVNGSLLIPLLRAGVPKTLKLSPMPNYADLSQKQLMDLVRWMHYGRQRARFRDLTTAPLPAGDAAAGKTYFDANCASCHSAAEARAMAARHPGDALRAAVLEPPSLRAIPSYETSAWSDQRLGAARQRHGFLLENAEPQPLANVLAFLR